MAMLPENGVQGLMMGILGSAAALAIAFPLALGGSVYDPAAATGAARTGLYATNGAGSESIAYVVGGQTGPIHLSNGSGVQTQLSGGTQTGASFPVLSLSQTWNNAATAFIAFFANITSTASATGSQLVNLQVGSVAQFTVSKAGDIGGGSLNVSRTITAGGAITLNQASGNAILTINAPTGSTPQVQFQINAVNKVNITAQSSASFQFNDNANTTTPISYTAGAIGAGFVTFANSTTSSSTSTGAVVVTGGVGIGGPLQVGGNVSLRGTSANIIQAAASSGVPTCVTLTPGANTGITAGTEAPMVNWNSGGTGTTWTWATGALATQRFFLYQAPTIAFAGASTVANAATVAITNSPQAGANATLTNSWALWVQAGQVLFGATTNPGITFNNGNIVTTGGSQPLTIAQSAVNAAIRYCIQVTPGNQTAITSGTESPQFVWVTHTNQWATTVPSTQREWIINAPTYSCDTAGQTIGTAVTFEISGSPIAGSNVSINNDYALRVASGNCSFNGQLVNAFGPVSGTFPAYFCNGASTITGGVTDGQTAGLYLAPTYNAASALTVTRHNYIKLDSPVLGGAGPAAVTDACAFWFTGNPGTHKALAADGAVAVTFTSLGPTGAQTTIQGWMKINVNGTLRFIPFW